MICKVVHRKSGKKAGFEGLGRYILDAKENDDVMFKRTAEYVLGEKGAGEKVSWCRVSNCHSEVPGAAIAEVLATQAANQRTKADKTFHLVVSFPAGERVSKEQAADIEETLCAGLGFAGHQRISAGHQDTDNFHVHIAINKIHPKTFRSVEPYNAYWKLDRMVDELEVKHGLHRDNGIGRRTGRSSSQKARELESHQDEQSFLGWLQENVGSELKGAMEKARGWQDIHKLFAKYGAEIKPRGAGLAIATVDGKVGIKASSLNRKLSLKALTERFGEYEPPKSRIKQLESVKRWVSEKLSKPGAEPVAEKRYEVGERKLSGAPSLYEEYKAAREGNYAARKRVLEDSRKKHLVARNRVRERYKGRREAVRAHKKMDARKKQSAYQELSLEMKAELEQLKKREQEDRQMLMKGLPVRSWDEYLAKRAEDGDREALKILRRRKSYRRQLSEALLTAENFGEALDYIKPHCRPTVLKNGKVIYRVKDGGVVVDEVQGIHVEEVTEAATVMALSLASERFVDKALVVEGTEEFKKQIVKAAALEGLSIRFADPALEQERKHHVLMREMKEKDQREAAQRREEREKQRELERKKWQEMDRQQRAREGGRDLGR